VLNFTDTKDILVLLYQGRAPDEDCMLEVDADGHALGGTYRFAVYAPYEIATCINNNGKNEAGSTSSCVTALPTATDR
jgi:hypothetical protein